MLREELLRAKNDEIAYVLIIPIDLILSYGPYEKEKSLIIFFRRCLLSRKRKLSELYFATVGFPGATESSPQGELYRRNEAAFLDANDLAKSVPDYPFSTANSMPL